MTRSSWRTQSVRFPLFLVTVLAAACAPTAPPAARTSPSTAGTPPVQRLRSGNGAILEEYGRLPLHFEENRGQADPSVDFIGRTQGATISLSPQGFAIGMKSGAVRVAFDNKQAAPRLEALEPLPGRINHYHGRNASWRANVATYRRVRYAGVYPDVDVVVYGNQRRLEYDFVVGPGGDPSRIALRIEDADEIRLDAAGDLHVRRGDSSIVQHAPSVYQERDGRREPVAGRYVMRGQNTLAFEIGEYDSARPLIIDPIVTYASFLGGFGTDVGEGIAVDAVGNIYVVGWTQATDFPTANAAQPTVAGDVDVFVAKLNPTGSGLIYSTYLGGSGRELASAIAVDG